MFRFQQFDIENSRAALKVGTDAVVLGASMSIPGTDALCALDIGTGTGVLALMAAQRIEAEGIREWKVTAIDIDKPSADEAADNFARSKWAANLCAIHSSLSEYAAGLRESERFGLIFSNPPYYDSSLRNPDAREAAARHTDNLSYREICSFAAERLTPAGRLEMILPSDQEKQLLRTAASFGLYASRLVRVSTTPTKPPRRLIAEFLRTRTSVNEEALVIGSDKYSGLVKDFLISAT